jgi:hypothetical protein
MSTPDFGTDVDGIYDCSSDFHLASGPRNLGNALGRRLITERGALGDDDPEYGTNVRRYLNAEMDATTTAALHSDVIAECEKDERVKSASCDSSFVFETRTLTLSILAQTATGVFRFVIALSDLTVSLLSAGVA